MSRHKLKRIEGHSGFYQNESSGMIYYKDEVFGKFSTGKRTIREAKRESEIIKKTKQHSISRVGAKRQVLNIDNPPIKELWFEMIEEKREEIEPGTILVWEYAYSEGFADFFAAGKGKAGENINDMNDMNLMKFKVWYLNHPVHEGKRHAVKMVVYIKSFLRWCLKKKVIRELPDLDILSNLGELVEKKAQRVKPGRVADEVAEIRPMIESAKKISTMALAMLLFGVRCGLRKESEALALKWEHIDFEKNNIRIWSKKNHKWRNVPLMADDLIEALHEHKKYQIENNIKSAWVFAAFRNPSTPTSGQYFDKIWKQILNTADPKIKGRFRFHDLRHTFATRTAEDPWWTQATACLTLDMSGNEYQKTYAKPSNESVAEMARKTYEKTKNQGVKP